MLKRIIEKVPSGKKLNSRREKQSQEPQPVLYYVLSEIDVV